MTLEELFNLSKLGLLICKNEMIINRTYALRLLRGLNEMGCLSHLSQFFSYKRCSANVICFKQDFPQRFWPRINCHSEKHILESCTEHSELLTSQSLTLFIFNTQNLPDSLEGCEDEIGMWMENDLEKEHDMAFVADAVRSLPRSHPRLPSCWQNSDFVRRSFSASRNGSWLF